MKRDYRKLIDLTIDLVFAAEWFSRNKDNF